MGKSKTFQSSTEIMKHLGEWNFSSQTFSKCPNTLNQKTIYIHIYTEQENSDFLTVSSLLMPLLPARLQNTTRYIHLSLRNSFPSAVKPIYDQHKHLWGLPSQFNAGSWADPRTNCAKSAMLRHYGAL